MRNFKNKVVALSATILASVMLLTSCSKPEPSVVPSQSETAVTESQTAEASQKVEPSENGTALKIAIVTSPSGVDDGSFNQDNYNGILSFIGKNPNSTVKAIKEPTGDPAACIQAVSDIVADYDVIVCTGFQFSGIGAIAEENPDKKFILVDTAPEPVGDKKEFENIYSMQFAEQESGFFAGIAAALETKTGKVAVVNGIAFPPNVNYQYGFMSGVNYANAKYGTKTSYIELAPYAGTDVTGAKVGGNYAGSFSDEAVGKVVGNALIKEGCDIIFVAAGATGNGVFTAAKEAKDVKIIGCDVDQFDDGVYGGGNIILTSVLKIMGMNVDSQLEAVKNGTFKGQNAVLGADSYSTGYVDTQGRHQLSDETLVKLRESLELVKDGKIQPASNFNGFKPYDFPGLK